MKLIRFSHRTEAIQFGVVIDDHAVAFETLLAHTGRELPMLRNSNAYLEALPESETQAREIATWGLTVLAQLPEADKPMVSAVRLHAPVEVQALFDFGLTPRHLANSAQVLAKYEEGDPHTSALLGAMRKMLLSPKPATPPGVPERLSYYKGNLNAVVGSGETVPWPVYTQYLDIEPELAVVYGNTRQHIAGYCIFNDVSARDVQAPEFIAGFCLSKDMAKGNQLGPWLVTADEVGDAFSLEVTVTVNDEVRWRGNTREISHRPEDMVRWLSLICPLQPGTVMGMGTIPDCTGLDVDDFIAPGSRIEIRFDRLGVLHTRFDLPARPPMPSRWPARDLPVASAN